MQTTQIRRSGFSREHMFNVVIKFCSCLDGILMVIQVYSSRVIKHFFRLSGELLFLCVLCVSARYICFCLSQRPQRTSMFDLLLPKNLCVLCALARVYLFLSLAEAQRPQRTYVFDLFLPRTPLRTLRLCEIIFVFFSRKGAKAAKNFDVYFVLTPNIFYS